jgi:dimeric dUTPase (all-alpha-NTP-PPase superfamily)
MKSDSPDIRTMDRSSTGAVENMDARVLEHDPLGCTWVESKATVSFGEHDTKHQAHAEAVSEARAKALHRFLGINVRQRFIDFQQESSLKGEVSLTERLLKVTQSGRILREHTLWSGHQDLPGCMGCRYGVHIRACILPEPERNDKEFSVNLSLKRTTLVDGDEATIEVTSTRDAYVYLYSVDMDWNAALIFPNDYVQDNYVKAAQVLIYPSEEIKRRGIKVVARLPVEASVSAEMIRVIASKIPLSKAIIYATEREHEGENLPGSSKIHSQGSFLTLMRQLNRTDTEWVEDAQAFTVHKR